jgi:hypothetical protein
MPAMIADLCGGALREGKFGGGGVFTAILRWRLLMIETRDNPGRSSRTNETRRFPDPVVAAGWLVATLKAPPTAAGRLLN